MTCAIVNVTQLFSILVPTEDLSAKVVAIPSATNGSASHTTIVLTTVKAIGSRAAVLRDRSLEVIDDRFGQVIGFIIAEERGFVSIEDLSSSR